MSFIFEAPAHCVYLKVMCTSKTNISGLELFSLACLLSTGTLTWQCLQTSHLYLYFKWSQPQVLPCQSFEWQSCWVFLSCRRGFCWKELILFHIEFCQHKMVCRLIINFIDFYCFFQELLNCLHCCHNESTSFWLLFSQAQRKHIQSLRTQHPFKKLHGQYNTLNTMQPQYYKYRNTI